MKNRAVAELPSDCPLAKDRFSRLYISEELYCSACRVACDAVAYSAAPPKRAAKKQAHKNYRTHAAKAAA